MAEQQWQSTTDHAPPPLAPGSGGGWQSTADHIEAPKPENAAIRFAKGTGIPGHIDQMTKPSGDSESPTFDRIRNVIGYLSGAPSTDNLKNAWEMVKGLGESTIDHVKKADEAGKNGDFAAALGHSLAAIPGIGQAGADIKDKIDKGDYAGAAGGLSMFLLPAAEGKLTSAKGTPAAATPKAPGVIARAVQAVSDIPNKGEIAAKMAEKIPIVKAVTPLLEVNKTTYTPPTPGGAGGVRQVPKGKITPVEYPAGAGHFGEELPPVIPGAPRPDPAWMRTAPIQNLADVAEASQTAAVDPAQVMRERLAARQRPAPVPPRPARPAPAWTQGPGPEVSRGTSVADLTELDPAAVQQMAQQRMAENLAARRRESSGINRILALRDEAPAASTPSPETPVPPAASPEMAAPAAEAASPPPIENGKTVADVAQSDSVTAFRNKAREEKFGKVIDHLLLEGFPEVGLKGKEVTPSNLARVRDISDRQWTAVADRAGVNALTKAQRAEVLRRMAVPNESPTPAPAAAEPATIPVGKTPDVQLPSQPAGRAGESAPPPLEVQTGAGASPSGTGGVSGSEAGSEPSRGPSDTEVFIPGEDKFYRAKYKLVDLSEVQASHNGQTFQPNPKYGLANDRDYTQPENQGKIVEGALASKFKPSLLITDNPDASNGPPLIDSKGNAIGGNGRTMILHRVYGENGDAAGRYRYTLKAKAAQYGYDPAMVDQMKHPVLVRQISSAELGGDAGAQSAVTDFNKTGTAALRAPERAIADSRKVSQGTLDHIAGRMDAVGPNATLAEVLNSPSGLEVFQRMVKDGVITPQETAAYVSGGKLTPEGVGRVSKLMLARYFKDPAQLDSMPTAMKNKLEKVAAPLAKADGAKDWSLTASIQEAMSLLEETHAHGFKNVDMTLKQSTLGGKPTEYSPQAVAIAKMFKGAKAGDLMAAARAYADMASGAAREAEQPSMFGGSGPSPSEAFQKTFGELAPKRAKPTGKTVADLAQ